MNWTAHCESGRHRALVSEQTKFSSWCEQGHLMLSKKFPQLITEPWVAPAKPSVGYRWRYLKRIIPVSHPARKISDKPVWVEENPFIHRLRGQKPIVEPAPRDESTLWTALASTLHNKIIILCRQADRQLLSLAFKDVCPAVPLSCRPPGHEARRRPRSIEPDMQRL